MNWKESKKGNQYCNVDGFSIIVGESETGFYFMISKPDLKLTRWNAGGTEEEALAAAETFFQKYKTVAA